MGYNKKIFEKVSRSYDGKYQIARERADARRAEVHTAHPDIELIDRTMSENGLALMSAVLGGKDGKQKIAEIREKNTALQAKKADLLEKYGYPRDYTDLKYDCPLCGDTGYVDTKMCVCMKRALAMEEYKASGIAELLKTQNFGTFDLKYYEGENRERMKNAVAYLKKYAEGFDTGKSGNLLFMGGTGLGKTHLSSAVAKEIIDRGFDVCYVGAPDMIADFLEVQKFQSDKADAPDNVERYHTCDFLIIDDLGAEHTTSFTLPTVYNVINTRMNAKRPTLISTNLLPKEITAKYGERVTSRLFGEYKLFTFDGTDIRRQRLDKR